MVASGAISLYLYPQVLALFSAVPYSVPISTDSVNDDSSHPVVDLTPHLTNTSLQTHRGDSEEGIRLLDELIGCSVFSTSNAVGSNSQHGLIFTADDVATIKDQMAIALSETFKAALEMPVHFQVRVYHFGTHFILDISSLFDSPFLTHSSFMGSIFLYHTPGKHHH